MSETSPFPCHLCGNIHVGPCYQHSPYDQPKQGWLCPVCRRVHAPFVTTCPYCVPVMSLPIAPGATR